MTDDEKSDVPLPLDKVPPHFRPLIGVVATSPTKCNGLIKGTGAAKHSESGWEAWKFCSNKLPIKVQKRQYVRKSQIVKFSGSGFINPVERCADHRAKVCASMGLDPADPNVQLPPLTALEAREYWFSRCSVVGTIKSFTDAL